MFPGSIGYQELVIIGVVAVILFGGRLPEVARTIGQSYQQFRKGLGDLQSSFTMDKPSTRLPDYSDSRDDYESSDGDAAGDEFGAPKSPRFEPPPIDSGSDEAEKPADEVA